MFTNDTLQEMFKNLKSLKHLQIHHVFGSNVTDFGFTGMVNGKQVGHSISELIYLETLYIHIRDHGISNETLMHIAQLGRLKSLKMEMSIIYEDEYDDSECPFLDYKALFPLLEHVNISRYYEELTTDIEDLVNECCFDIYKFTDITKMSPTLFKLFQTSAPKFLEELKLELEDNIVW